jgi:hypothetical protein
MPSRIYFFALIPMKRVVLVLFLLAGLFLHRNLFAQCDSSIKLVKAKNDRTKVQNGGEIEILVTSNRDYTCTLLLEKGSGPEKLVEKKGVGTQKIRFDGLNKDELYRVVVEFPGEKNNRCRAFQESQITLE